MNATGSSVYIDDIYPLKAQFLRNEEIHLAVFLGNNGLKETSADLVLKVLSLTEVVEVVTLKGISLQKGVTRIEVDLSPQDVSFCGYGVDAFISPPEEGEEINIFSSAFDVVASWRMAPRYGFVSDFDTKDLEDIRDIEFLSKLHINMVQFYDWMYRHDNLVPGKRKYRDLLNRPLDFKVIRKKIEACKQRGMRPIAYGAVYTACLKFFEEHREWALYNDAGKEISFIDIFYLMDISGGSPWADHIIEEYRKAISEAGFDGIHMDTYGFPKTAYSSSSGSKKLVVLEEEFAGFIRKTRKRLESEKDVTLIFNNVRAWPLKKTGLSPQDAVYIEVWNPYKRYSHINHLIQDAKVAGGGKPVILAAYLSPFKEEDLPVGEAETSALILTAVITSFGAYHLLLGGKEGVLTQGYYVNYRHLRKPFIRRIRTYYDFIIRYSTLFFNPEMEDVSMTHLGGDFADNVCEGFPYSPDGEPGKVWTIIRETKKIKTISFINLTGNKEDLWNKGKTEPPVVKNLIIKIRVPGEIKSLFLASPDTGMGRPRSLRYREIPDALGMMIEIIIPEVKLFSLLVLEHT
ncbi:MAG: hypothetical protein GXP33_05510 [Spirochaetes bacterium]|nr:hypothetical protein [Spirochaetota bacterium]